MTQITSRGYAPAQEPGRRRGAREQRIHDRLAEACGADAIVLWLSRHRRRAEADHVVVAPSGVYVVGVEHHRRAKVAVRGSRRLLGARKEQLFVGGRNRTSLVDDLENSVARVKRALAVDAEGAMPSTDVLGIVCFLDAELPLFTDLSVREHPIRGPRGTGRILSRHGDLGATQRRRLADHLVRSLAG